MITPLTLPVAAHLRKTFLRLNRNERLGRMSITIGCALSKPLYKESLNRKPAFLKRALVPLLHAAFPSSHRSCDTT